MIAYTVAVFAYFLPGLYFFPRIGAWKLAPIPGEPAILWYGWLIYAAVGGALGMAAGAALGRRPPGRVVAVASAVSLLLLAWHERGWFAR